MNKFVKKDVVDLIAGDFNYTKKDVAVVIDEVINFITTKVADGDEVFLNGLGTFRSVDRSARIGRNPKTGESMNIAASRSIKFAPASAFKKIVKS